MALLFTAQSSSLFLSQTLKFKTFISQSPKPISLPFPFPIKRHKSLKLSSFITLSSSQSDPKSESDSETPASIEITDEWGENTELGSKPELIKLPDSDPPRNEDEWEEEYVGKGNGNAATSQVSAAVSDVAGVTENEGTEGYDDRVEDLKRCLVDSVYGTDLGFRASQEERAE